MTRLDIISDFIKKSVMTFVIAFILYNGFIQLCISNGAVNYMYLVMLCGIPFGIRYMFTLPVFIGNMGVGIAMTCFNIAIGALIGGFILLWKLIVAIWYVPLTVVRMVRA